MIGIGMMPVAVPGLEEVMARVESYKDTDIERLKLAKFIIEFSKEVEETRADAFGKSSCQIIRSLARAEAEHILGRIKDSLNESAM